MGPACRLSPGAKGLMCRRGSGDPLKEGWTPRADVPCTAPARAGGRHQGPVSLSSRAAHAGWTDLTGAEAQAPRSEGV